MKQLLQVVAGLLTLLAVHGAQAGTLSDNFVGNDAHGGAYGDVIGNSTYDISGAKITRVGSVLTVVINTNFAGNAGGNPSIGYGDLFLSNVWSPAGTSADKYAAANATNGTVWQYALHIDDTKRAQNAGGALTLYQLKGATNAANIWNSDQYLGASCTGSCDYRNNQAVGVNMQASAANVSQVATATTVNNKWSVGAGTVTFTMDIAGTALMNYSSFAMHWGETCQNDVIEGSASVVPEPGAIPLAMLGLGAMLAIRRRKQRRN